MRSQTFDHEQPPGPLRALRVLIEDPVLADPVASITAGFDLTICSGPDHESEICPLVVDGSCPLGSFDVVVGALDGSWASAVRAAWAETSTPYLDHRAAAPVDPSGRLHHHLGDVVRRVFDRGPNSELDL